MEKKSCHKLEFSICYENESCNPGEGQVLAFRYLTAEGIPITEFQEIMIPENTVKMDITIWGIRNQGEYRLEFEYHAGGKNGKGSCKAIIIA